MRFARSNSKEIKGIVPIPDVAVTEAAARQAGPWRWLIGLGLVVVFISLGIWLAPDEAHLGAVWEPPVWHPPPPEARSSPIERPPGFHLEPTQTGDVEAHWKEGALQDWCLRTELPTLPTLPPISPVVAQVLLGDLLVAATPRADASTPNARATAFGRLGLMCESRDAHARAERYLTWAAQGAPSDPRWAYYLGCIYQITGRTKEAADALLHLLNLDPDYAYAHIRLGSIYLEDDRLDAAAVHFDGFRALHPEAPHGLVGLARAALRDGRATKAVDLLTRAMSLAPDDFSCHYYLSQAYIALGDREQANRHSDACRTIPEQPWVEPLDPLDLDMRALTVSTAELAHQFELLRLRRDFSPELCELIVARDPNGRYPRVRLALVAAYRRAGRTSDAERLLEPLMRAAPTDGAYRKEVIELLLDTGRFEDALDELRTALDPGEPS